MFKLLNLFLCVGVGVPQVPAEPVIITVSAPEVVWKAFDLFSLFNTFTLYVKYRSICSSLSGQ